jgi:MPBQ/MSBQ methyltransferase
MRFIQHKREAWWFYRFLSPLYDRWVNPLFWTAELRDGALELAELDDPGLRVLDVGAGTGFSTEGIVARVSAGNVTLLDQSPHQLARARRKPALEACAAVLGDAERLPFPAASFDRYVSCGSVEYWPDPQRAVAESMRVVRPGGVALLVGPLPPRARVARWLSELWMLFPPEREYREWYERAGFADVRVETFGGPWGGDGYGIAIAGRRPDGAAALPAPGAPAESVDEPMTLGRRLRFAGRFLAGSAAGALFVPVGLVLNFRARRRAGR